MFAPHCPTCARRVLLGPRRVVGLGGRLHLRCHCGELLAWDQQPPPAQAVAGSDQEQAVS
ncbi:hypothetical protein [Actinomarinicola tropica]|uniref:hypothetical protein n=1 Tax=Actinomarinicola tropica TaxID=2789776 RepID=UPI00189A184C|nr:hypothetical protein [Actinomarinicola tropica]